MLKLGQLIPLDPQSSPPGPVPKMAAAMRCTVEGVAESNMATAATRGAEWGMGEPNMAAPMFHTRRCPVSISW